MLSQQHRFNYSESVDKDEESRDDATSGQLRPSALLTNLVEMERTSTTTVREEKLELQFAASQNANVIMEIDLHGNISWLSPSWRNVYGTRPEDVLGKAASEIFVDDTNALSTAFQDMQEQETVSFKMQMKANVAASSPEPLPTRSEPLDEEAGDSAHFVDLECQGILVRDRKNDIATHSMWVLRPMIPPQHHILDLPPIIVDSLGFGVQILTRYLSTLSKENMANPQDNPPPMPILCRICERQIQPWWFEKHTELCLSEHKAESQVLLCQDNLRDQQRELMRLMEVFGFDASATTEYHGQTISPSPSPSAASTLMQSRGREISISPRSKKRPLHNGPTVRMLEMILDLCATALDISTPAIKDTDLEQPSEELRTQSPQSEARISQVLQWQSPNIENPVLAAVLSDTESYARHKVDSVLRLRNIIHYSERIRQELYVAVEETIVETIGKAQGIPNLDFHAGVDELISPFQAATLGPKYQRSPILSPRLLDESPPSGSPQEAATPRSISGRPAIYDRKYSGTVLDDDVQSDSSSIHQNELDKIESPQSDSETVPRFFTERKKSSLYGGSPRRVMSPTRNYSPSSLKAPRQRVPSIFNLSGQSTATLEAPSSAPTFPFDHTHHRRQSSVTSDISKLSQSPRTSKLTMINQKPNPPSIKDFEIIKPISKGAFGSVYLSKKKSTGDYYAIKVLKKADMVSKNQITNIKAERAILMAQGESPFVANLFFTFQSKDYLYLVMEYLNGGDCAALLKALGRLDEVWAKRYLAEVVLGVQHLHERGIIHRDLKPDNLLIDSHGHLKLTDFGLSRMGLIGRQNRVRGSNASDTPDLLHQGPFARPPSFASSRSASFDFMASPVQTPYLIPDIQQHPNLSYFQSRNDNDGISRRTSGTRSDSGSESIYSALGSFSLNDANLIKRIDDDARSDSSNSSDVSAAAAHPLASLSQVTSSQQHMPPPALALFDPNDESRKFVGTPDYLAPETINGGGQDEMSDWWSIGCILFEFLLGYPPFHADTPERVFQNILNRRIDWPKEDDLISQEVSEDAKDLIGRLICLDPSTRLGANGAKEVKSHPYFRAVKWDALLNEEASFVPQLTHAESTDYFDDRGATLQTFTEEQVEENGSSLYASMLPGGTEVPSENLKKDASFPKRSNAIPLHIRPHVREKRTRRLSEPSGLDTFGSFTFKNLPVLEKANKEVIQRLRSEHSTVSRPRHTSLSGIGFRRPGSPASSSSSAQTSISPARSSQPSSPATVSAPFSASSTGSVGHTSFPKLQKSQSGTSCQSSFPFEVPHELGRTQSLSSGSQGGHLRLSSSSNFSPMRTELVALIGPGVEANPPSTAPKNKVSRSRANTAGSDDRCSVIEVLRRNKAQSQVFDISPSSSENEDGRVSVLARVQRRRQDSRRMSSRSFTTGPRFRRLDVLYNPVSRVIIENILERLRCRTVVVSDGAEAARCATGDVKFDIILTEFKLPKLNGEDAARLIRSMKNINCETPIVAVTNYLKDIYDPHLFDGMIEKPVNPMRMQSELERLCAWVPENGAGHEETSLQNLKRLLE